MLYVALTRVREGALWVVADDDDLGWLDTVEREGSRGERERRASLSRAVARRVSRLSPGQWRASSMTTPSRIKAPSYSEAEPLSCVSFLLFLSCGVFVTVPQP